MWIATDKAFIQEGKDNSRPSVEEEMNGKEGNKIFLKLFNWIIDINESSIKDYSRIFNNTFFFFFACHLSWQYIQKIVETYEI